MKIPDTTTAAEGGATVGRQERRRRKLHDHLYDTAVGLFVAHGFEATTMEQIAEAADVARATVFNHYAQKIGFLEEWGTRRRARVAGILGAQHAEDLPVDDRLRRYLEEMADLNIGSRAETSVLMDASARYGRLLQDPSLEVELARIVEEGLSRGEIRAGVDCGQAGELLAMCYFSTVLRWVREEPAPFDLQARLRGALDIVLTGLLAGREDTGRP
ncbi:TetR/AcrR family transcriptional regulator [Streptomyces sp. NPDC101175]|uniref:TetR/AcrR family transcriptional regulator n=1 Tax=Streptomyces sp. NPDC101175 TaxID=3366123 RepID=UPI0038338424